MKQLVNAVGMAALLALSSTSLAQQQAPQSTPQPQPQPILPPLTPQLPVSVSPKDKHQPKTETTNSYAAAIQELEGLVGLEDVKKSSKKTTPSP